MSDTDLARCDVSSDWASDFSQCLYEWLGLEGAGLALLAAYFGVRYLKRQIKQASDHRQDEIARRHNAARLTLPLALAAVSKLIQETISEITYELEQLGPDGFNKAFDASLEGKANRRNFNPVQLPDDVISAFRQLVESLTNPQDIRHVAELIASLQIYLARYNDFDLRSPGMRKSLEGLLLDGAKIQLLNDKIYNYARFVDDTSFGIVGVGSFNDAWDAIHGKAQGLVFRRDVPDVFFPAFKERVDRFKEVGASPWLEKFVP